MSAKTPLSLLRRIERQWAERIESPGPSLGQIVAATKRALQGLFGDRGSLIPVAVTTLADRRRPDRRRSRD
jgi:hypothetical protein